MKGRLSTDPAIDGLIRELIGQGWQAKCQGAVKLQHPTGLVLVTSRNPHDRRAADNFRAAVHRARASLGEK